MKKHIAALLEHLDVLGLWIGLLAHVTLESALELLLKFDGRSFYLQLQSLKYVF